MLRTKPPTLKTPKTLPHRKPQTPAQSAPRSQTSTKHQTNQTDRNVELTQNGSAGAARDPATPRRDGGPRGEGTNREEIRRLGRDGIPARKPRSRWSGGSTGSRSAAAAAELHEAAQAGGGGDKGAELRRRAAAK